MICNQRFDIKVVAAAILINKRELHVEELTSLILNSELSTLGLKGKTPPRQTVTSVLSTNYTIFANNRRANRRGDGFWWLNNSDEVLRDPEVSLCFKMLTEHSI
ncbi:MAG: hypothetical protein WD872_16590 [Pirellulaceae bacterium]